jgi:hypothetical protein
MRRILQQYSARNCTILTLSPLPPPPAGLVKANKSKLHTRHLSITIKCTFLSSLALASVSLFLPLLLHELLLAIAIGDNVSFINKAEYFLLLFSLHVYFDTNKFSMVGLVDLGWMKRDCFLKSHEKGSYGCERRDKQFIFWMNMLVVTAFSFLSFSERRVHKKRAFFQRHRRERWQKRVLDELFVLRVYMTQ